MVHFENNKLIIEIESTNPAETWREIHTGICHIVRNVNRDNLMDESFFYVIDFIEELMPDYALLQQLKTKKGGAL